MAMSLLTATPPLEGGGEHRGQLESSMMSEKQRYCLKWNNYQANVTTTFKELLAVEDFVDITLSAEGGALKAHKVVLSACSPYFRDILKVKKIVISLSKNPSNGSEVCTAKLEFKQTFTNISLISIYFFRAFLHGSIQSLC